MEPYSVNSWDIRDSNGKLIYGYPYTNKCPDCGEEAMKGDVCTACGKDNHYETCPKCGRSMNNRYFTEWGGCFICNAEDKRKKEQEEHSNFIKDYYDYTTYPEKLQALVKYLFENGGGLDYASCFFTKKDMIEFVRGIYKCCVINYFTFPFNNSTYDFWDNPDDDVYNTLDK